MRGGCREGAGKVRGGCGAGAGRVPIGVPRRRRESVQRACAEESWDPRTLTLNLTLTRWPPPSSPSPRCSPPKVCASPHPPRALPAPSPRPPRALPAPARPPAHRRIAAPLHLGHLRDLGTRAPPRSHLPPLRHRRRTLVALRAATSARDARTLTRGDGGLLRAGMCRVYAAVRACCMLHVVFAACALPHRVCDRPHPTPPPPLSASALAHLHAAPPTLLTPACALRSSPTSNPSSPLFSTGKGRATPTAVGQRVNSGLSGRLSRAKKFYQTMN